MITAGALAFVLLLGVFVGWQYATYSRVIDKQLEAGPFSDTMNLYSAPRTLGQGEKADLDDLGSTLYRIGYREQPGARGGWFRTIGKNAVEIHPREDSPFAPVPARVTFARGKIAGIVPLGGAKPLTAYTLDPELIANVSADREKRRLVRYNELPRTLVNAVLASEDKRFFEHSGLDALRMAKAAWVDLKNGRKDQGASTLTMQLARNLWLDPEKSWRRKFHEMLMAAHLEHKLTKQQIFEYYSNEVYMGRRATYSIHGFGQASWEYFGKDIRQLTLAEAATLAGMIQRPAHFDPARNPAHATARRDLVLRLMLQNGYIDQAQYRAAVHEPMRIAPRGSRSNEAASYFVDLAGSELQHQFPDTDVPVRDVYTTIDADLQRAAVEAINTGMAKVDAIVKKRYKKGAKYPKPQVALVAIDPHTGEIRALAGGRNYAESQLNRALARRPPGSTFKPFVYAAALSTALGGGPNLLTPASLVDDDETTFQFGDETYQPGNFKHTQYGQMTLRQALARSDNIATVKVAETVGYGRVADLARSAGLVTARGTPAVALGSYDATPLELAGAYTVFSNGGAYVEPSLVAEVRDHNGRAVYTHTPQPRQVLDPRIAYLMVNMLEGVMNNGTGYSARAAGFWLPAAGKTGTARDGWFAGFTSELLTVVWVGFDDYSDLKLEGAKSAAPVWAEFMKRAHALPRYSHAREFPVPAGVTSAEIDPETGELAGPNCFDARLEYFIAGTEPTVYCELHSNQAAASWPGAAPAPAASALPVIVR